MNVSLFDFRFDLLSVSEFVSRGSNGGGEVSLLCSNLSSFITNIFWFKMDKRANATKITSMTTAESNVTVREEFKNGRFQMSSNSTHVSLNISEVDSSDSGLYFCGVYKNSGAVIFDATSLQVEETLELNLVTGILGSIIFILLMTVISLIIKVRSCQTASSEQQRRENQESDALNYAALTFQLKPKEETESDQNRFG
ncbi:hypothetical protein OJAV_G00179070 [Oryzias javanicus]|uniref:Ig-like domain-containing protein n=1 Tax=Oryzias javanicus TaxID=123683 RepID=A0A437CBT0_ORYJA|nr:hypothetical protein OJAV_G00179070 [Oryzias javanicus]